MTMRLLRKWSWLALFVLAVGCSDASTGSGANDAGTQEDLRTRPGRDAIVGEGEVGTDCEGNEDCRSGLCIRIAPSAELGLCSQECAAQADCPDDTWDCSVVRGAGEDGAVGVQVCLPATLCLDEDGDEYGLGPGCRGLDCDEANAEVNPGELEVCDGFDNDCSLLADDHPADANVDCATGEPGICAQGRLFCVGGELDCQPLRSGVAESCDGLDNDCDGQQDEGPEGDPLVQDCYGGENDTLNVGECVGGQRTCSGGEYGACVGQALPFLEACDGADNDCDGEADEENPGGGRICVTDLEGICSSGLTACQDGETVCVASETPAEEVCDGLDNDCDGDVDEDEVGEPLARDCYDGDEDTIDVGLCHGGTQTCDSGESLTKKQDAKSSRMASSII
jgi:hypothetical protein